MTMRKKRDRQGEGGWREGERSNDGERRGEVLCDEVLYLSVHTYKEKKCLVQSR